MTNRILVTDGDQRAALAVVRSLGARGDQVMVVSVSGHSIAGASRWAIGERTLPDPMSQPKEFTDTLSALAREWGPAVLLPISEQSLLAVLSARERFEAILVPFPQLEAFRCASDKALVLAEAANLGIASPAQATVVSPAAAIEELECLDGPLVLKPYRSVVEIDGARVRQGVRYASDRNAAVVMLRSMPVVSFPVLVQQRIVGPGIGVFILDWPGWAPIVFGHRRIREKPPSGGVSVYRESLVPDSRLAARSLALLKRLGWWGVAMVEYKVDHATGRPYLMEINPRFWGSLQLAVDAGVDFPALLVAAALGQPPCTQPSIRTGIRSRWWLGDLDHLIARLRPEDGSKGLPPDLPPPWRAVLEFLVLWRPGDRSEVFRWRDPGPGLVELAAWLRGRGT